MASYLYTLYIFTYICGKSTEEIYTCLNVKTVQCSVFNCRHNVVELRPPYLRLYASGLDPPRLPSCQPLTATIHSLLL